MNSSDEDLAYAAASGDRDAFAALLHRRYDGLFGLCFRLTGSRADAEDLTQDICSSLPARLETYRREARFTTWLWRVAVNAAHDRRRKQQTHARHASDWGDWELNRRAADRDDLEQLDWLTVAMRALPEELRDTLALVLDDATHAEAGDVLGVSEGTISWRISQAKKRLRALRQTEDHR